MVEPIVIAAAVALGVAYGIVGYWSKRDSDESFNPKKFARTVVLYAAAGVVVASGDGVITEAALGSEAQALGAGFVGTIFDMVWSRIHRGD